MTSQVILAVGSIGAVEQVQDHKDGENHNAAIDMGEEGFKPVENTEQEQNLNGEAGPGSARND